APDGAELRQAFNLGADRVRLLMIVSPTSFGSRLALRLVQRYVLEKNADPNLEVLVVWEPFYPIDSERIAQQASTLIADPRVQQFWSPHQFAGKSFPGFAVGSDKPGLNSFLVFAGGKLWTDAAPSPDRVRRSPQTSAQIPDDVRMNGLKLGQEIDRILAQGRQPAPAGRTAAGRSPAARKVPGGD